MNSLGFVFMLMGDVEPAGWNVGLTRIGGIIAMIVGAGVVLYG